MKSFLPPFTTLEHVTDSLLQNGFALLQNQDFFSFTKTKPQEWESIQAEWAHLDLDQYLKDGGKYRKRKHANLIIANDHIEKVPYRPHFQPTSYNALHGGMHRWFSECSAQFIGSPALANLFISLTQLFDVLEKSQELNQSSTANQWFTEVHQFRIDTANGIGRPTPEGAHRDGVNYVAVLLVDRHAVKGGESRVFSADSPHGQRFTLEDAWTLLILDDLRVLHETTPIQPLDPLHPEKSWRDTLVLTFRKGDFLDAASSPNGADLTKTDNSSC